METPEEFLKHYHNNNPNDWLFEKREVVARLIKEYTKQALRIHGVVGQGEQLVCDECGDTGRSYPTLQEPDGVECEKCKAN